MEREGRTLDRLALAALLAACVSLPSRAFAEDGEALPSPTPTPEAAAQQVTVTSSRPGEAAGATGSAQTVELGDYAARAVRTSDVLDRIPGVDVQSFGAGSGSYLRIRGASADEVLVLVDGVRMNPGGGGGTDLDSIPFDLLDSVVVTRGAGAARFGADALGGVVEFRSDPEARRARAALTVGSFGSERGSAAAAVTRGGWSFDLAARGERVGDRYRYRDEKRNEMAERTNAGSEGFGGAGGVRGPLLGGQLSLRAFGTTRDGGAPGLSEFPTKTATHGEDVGTAFLRWAAEGWDFQVSQRLYATRFRDPTPSLGPSIATSSHESATSAGVTGQGVRGILGWSAGADARNEQIGSASTGEHERRIGGAHAGVVATAHRFDFEAAARVEGDEEERSGGGRALTWAVLPSAGVAWRPGRRWTLRAHGGRAYRVPSFSEKWLPSQETISGNPDLEPENAWTADAGASFCAGDGIAWGFTADAALFYTLISQSIVLAPVSPYRFEPVNSGRGRLSGGELGASLETEWAELSGSWTHTDTYREDTGAPLPGRPRDKAVGRAAGRFGGGAIETFIEAGWQSEAYADFFGNLTTPAGTLAGAGVTASIRRGRLAGVSLTLEGTNLGNADVRDARFFPQPGRAFWLTLAWRSPKSPSASPGETR